MPLPRQPPRRELIRKFRALGFEGPYEGGKHPFMKKGKLKVRVPNPHGGDIGVDLLRRVLRQASRKKNGSVPDLSGERSPFAGRAKNRAGLKDLSLLWTSPWGHLWVGPMEIIGWVERRQSVRL